MLRRSGTVTGSSAEAAGNAGDASSRNRPNLTGDLDRLLTPAPSFHIQRRGYDRLQVDNYVMWAESELVAARGEVDHVLSRYGATAAELELARRLLAQAPKARDLSPISDRVAEILRLAGDEATEALDTARAEADQMVAEARLEADAQLRKAHEIKEAAVGASDQLRALASADRAEGQAALQKARAEAENMLREARAEHSRLTAELEERRPQLADLQAQLADLQAQLDELRRQRDDACELLHRLTERIGQALDAVTGGTAERFVLVGNRVEVVAR